MSEPTVAEGESDESAVETRTLPRWLKPAFNVINPLMKVMLRSPLHGLVSGAVLLVTFTGRKSGREYTTPVGYEAVNGTIYITSQTDRVWWKNLRGGAEVSVRHRGDRRAGHAEVIEDNERVADYVLGFVDRNGLDSIGRLALSFAGDEVPDRSALAAGLDVVAVIEIELTDGN